MVPAPQSYQCRCRCGRTALVESDDVLKVELALIGPELTGQAQRVVTVSALPVTVLP